MKKAAVAVILVLALTMFTAGVAYAGSAFSNARADFAQFLDRAPDAWGHAIINYDKEEGAWEISGSLHNLAPETDYYVEVAVTGYPPSPPVATFTTDTEGKASFHNVATNLPAEYNSVAIKTSAGVLIMLAREDGSIGRLQFRGERRGQ